MYKYTYTFTILLFLSLCFRFCPESIRWLLANNKKNEALAILQKAEKFNGKK